MNIGLIDVDGHNFPNLALMKLAAYHKSIGDNVGWYIPIRSYDKIYRSKIFTFTPEKKYPFENYNESIKGGTGYDFNSELFCDQIQPDYDLYNKFSWYKEKYNNTALGYLTRGCTNKCDWCIVPKKEGDIKPYMDIEDVIQNKKSVVLMDNNILSCDYGILQIEKIIQLGIKVDFNQGLDCRIIAKNENIAELLSNVKWRSPLRMACDTFSQIEYIEKATELLRKHKTTPSNYFIYVLVKEIPDALKRIEILKKLKLDPFAQPYIDFSGKNKVTKDQKRFARWVNRKAIFKTVEFKYYK